MNTIIGLAVFGVVIMVALFFGQILLYMIFGVVMLVFTAIAGAFMGIVRLFKGE